MRLAVSGKKRRARKGAEEGRISKLFSEPDPSVERSLLPISGCCASDVVIGRHNSCCKRFAIVEGCDFGGCNDSG